MAKERKWPEWPELKINWINEHLISRWQNRSTTVDKNITRILDWIGLMIYVAAHEYDQREALTRQVAHLQQQLDRLQDRVAQLENRE